MSKHYQKLRPIYPRESVREKALVAQRDDLVAQLDIAAEAMREMSACIADLEELAEYRRLDLVELRGYG